MSEWTKTDETIIVLAKIDDASGGGIDVGLVVDIETNGTLMRATGKMTEHDEPVTIARWRPGIPASVRVTPRDGMSFKDRMATLEQLRRYVETVKKKNLIVWSYSCCPFSQSYQSTTLLFSATQQKLSATTSKLFSQISRLTMQKNMGVSNRRRHCGCWRGIIDSEQ